MNKEIEKILTNLKIVEKDLDIVRDNSKDELMKRLAVDIKLRVKDSMLSLAELEVKIAEGLK